MSKKKKKAKNHRNNEITKGIFTVLEAAPQEAFDYKQIASKIGLESTQDRNQLIKRLDQLKEGKRIEEKDRGKFTAISNHKNKEQHTGKVDLTSRGDAYVVIESLDDDVFVPQSRVNKAFHGDTVEVNIFRRRKGKKLEGEITAILERKKTEFVGILDMQKTFAFVRPTDFRMYTDFFVPKGSTMNANNGDKVVVRFESWVDKGW